MGNWVVDFGATSHMTLRREYLVNYRQFDITEKVGVGDRRVVETVGVGDVSVSMQFKVTDNKKAVLHDVLFIPKLPCNLFSERVAMSKGNTIRFGRSKCCIQNRSGNVHGIGSLRGKLYHLARL